MRTTAHRPDDANRARDIEAASLASSALADLLPERDARWRIAALLRGAGIVEQVAGRLQLAHQERADLIDGLYDLADAVVVGVGRPAKLDLARLADGASFCGWARQFLSSHQVRTTVMRRSWARSRREVQVTGHDDEPIIARPTDHDDDLGCLDEETAEAAIACFDGHARGLRSCGRAHLTAHTLAAAFQLPRPRRAIDLEDHDYLLALVEEEPRAVHEALRCWRSAPGSEPSGLAVLFDDWTSADVCSLLELQPVVAQALALAALTPVPPPQTQHVIELRRRLERSAGRRPEVKALTDAFTALVAETTTSEFDARRPMELKAADERAADRDRFEALAHQIVAQGWIKLGSNPGEVEAHLRSMLDQLRYGEVAVAA